MSEPSRGVTDPTTTTTPYDTMNGSDSDENARVPSPSSDNDNERVREKLKQTTIAPESNPSSGSEDHPMSTAAVATSTTTTKPEEGRRRTRKRSHDESDEDKKEDGNERRRVKAHERKRSREVTEADRLRAGSGLERVKTPPTHPEESEGIAERVASPLPALERKRSLGKLDNEVSETEDQKKKVTKTEEENRESGAAAAEGGEAAIKLPESSGFNNTSTKSPFATGGVNLFGSSSSSTNLFAQSKFGALSGSSSSPFGTLGAKSGSSSPFGGFGSKSASSGFGSGGAFGSKSGASPFGSSSFGATVLKSQPAKKFGAPELEEDKSDDDDDNSSDEGDDKKERLAREEESEYQQLGLKEQEVITGEENEITIFKCQATVFSWDGAAKQWKERGRGTLKVNRTTPSVGDFGLASDDEGDEKRPAHKKSARLIMRTDGTYVVILNCPIYKDMSLGDEPSANTKQLNIVAQEQNGGLVGLTIRLRSPALAKELYKHVSDLKKEIWG